MRQAEWGLKAFLQFFFFMKYIHFFMSLIGCPQRTFFQNENSSDKLSALKRNSHRPLSLKKFSQGTCKVNATSSWYIGCHGNKTSLGVTIETFTIEWESDAYRLKVKKFVRIRIN